MYIMVGGNIYIYISFIKIVIFISCAISHNLNNVCEPIENFDHFYFINDFLKKC